MNIVLNEFKEKFRVNDYKIYETENWVWSLRPHQATIGAGILSLKRECPAFSELKPEEFVDLGNIIKIIESSLKKTFGYDVINYLMLMMFDRQVHYHIFPRYESSIIFKDEEWKDESWPAVPALMGDKVTEKKAQEIVDEVRNNI